MFSDHDLTCEFCGGELIFTLSLQYERCDRCYDVSDIDLGVAMDKGKFELPPQPEPRKILHVHCQCSNPTMKREAAGKLSRVFNEIQDW